MRYLIICLGLILGVTTSCDHVDNPYLGAPKIDLDTTLYPGLWSDYVANEWPTFLPNAQTDRNVLIEDFTGHKCTYCPAAADLAHQLKEDNPGRVYVATIHSGPGGIGDFQSVTLPDYPTDFTNAQGLQIGTYYGNNDGGFPGNPRGAISRITSGGAIFQSPTQWTALTNAMLSANSLKVKMQSKLNYYPTTKGAYLHLEIEKVDANLVDDLAVVVYMIEDSIVGDQKMGDNSHNASYVHRDIQRNCVDGRAFGRTLTSADLTDGKYYVNYSFKIPNQLDGNFNAENMYLLCYVYSKSSHEVFQVIKQKIVP